VSSFTTERCSVEVSAVIAILLLLQTIFLIAFRGANALLLIPLVDNTASAVRLDRFNLFNRPVDSRLVIKFKNSIESSIEDRVSSWDAFSIGMSSDARIERSIIAVVA
jgi:hypothetical protein